MVAPDTVLSPTSLLFSFDTCLWPSLLLPLIVYFTSRAKQAALRRRDTVEFDTAEETLDLPCRSICSFPHTTLSSCIKCVHELGCEGRCPSSMLHQCLPWNPSLGQVLESVCAEEPIGHTALSETALALTGHGSSGYGLSYRLAI